MRMRNTIILILIPLVLCFMHGMADAVFPPKKPQYLWQHNLSLAIPNDPLVIDLEGDNSLEIIFTDTSGHVLVLRADTGRQIWNIQLKDKGSLTPPVAGDFLGDGSLDIVVGTSNGFLYLIDGATGKVIHIQEVGNKITLAPTLIPLKTDAPYPQAGVIISDDQGNVFFYKFMKTDTGDPKYVEPATSINAQEIWKMSVGARVTAPVSVGQVTGIGHVNVVVGTSNGDLWILNRDNKDEKIRFVNYGNRSISTIPALGQLQGDECREIVYGDLGGNLNAVYFSHGQFHRLWRKVCPIYENPHQSLVLQDLNDDGVDDIVAVTTSYVFGINGATGISLWTKDRLSLSYQVISEPGLVYHEGVNPILIFGDIRSICYFVDLANGTQPNYCMMKIPFMKAPVIFNAGAGKESHVLLTSEENSLARVMKLDLPLPSGLVVWECRGGNQLRSCKIDPFYTLFLEGEMNHTRRLFTEYLEKAEKARSGKNWGEALQNSRMLLTLQPHNKIAGKMHAVSFFRHYLLIIIFGTLMSIALSVFTGTRLYRIITTLLLVSKAREYEEKEELEEASRYYKRALSRNPNNRGITCALGKVLSRLGDFAADTIPIFETLYQGEPENPEALKALAHAYSHSQILEDNALDVYQKARDRIEDPSVIELLMGKIYYKKGQYELAGKHIRNALRGGQTDLETYNCLADIYMAMRYRTHKALPVFKKVYEARKNDQAFLEALCDAYIDARITDDPQVKEICQSAIAGNPRYLPAYIHLAKIYIQERFGEGAAQCASRILEIDPENKEGLLLQSQYYLLENQKDDEALKVYAKTLKMYPEDKEILKIISHIYFEKRRYDKEAEDIYKRSLALNPTDALSLLSLAQIAKQSQNHDLAISAIEKLMDLGQFTQDLVLQLADAYRVKHYTAPRAEKVYQAALKIHQEHEEYTLLLAEVLLKQLRTDVSSLPYYEKALKLFPERYDIGKQLIKAYLENKKFESASQLSRYILSRNPGDEETRRHMALADLQSNKLDEAIAEYNTILKKNPSDRESLINIAQAYAQKRILTDTAFDIYQKALKLAPENESLHRILASFLVSKGRLSEGLKEFDRAIAASRKATDAVIEDGLALLSENPDCVELRWYVCDRMIESNRFREAMDHLQIIFESDPNQVHQILPYHQKILEKDPQNALAQLRYGLLLKILGHVEEARQSMEQAYQIMPNNPEIQKDLIEMYEYLLEENENIEIRFLLGRMYMLNEEYDKAISCFQKTLQDFRWETESIKNLGKCFVQKGMLDLALQEFKKLPIDDELKEILYQLAQHFEAKNDLVGAKQVYKQLFAADINFRNVKAKFEMLAGSTSDPMVFEKTTILNSLSEKAKRRYELLEELGRGAMGIVYRAKDNELDDIVALKILPDNLSNNPEAVHRFKTEARSARRLSHPNIVRIHDIGEEMGRKYISMEFVDGTDLKKIYRESGGRIPLRQIILYMIVTSRALAYAHSIGIIHRDVKPANILISGNNEVKITDFGIAKMIESTDATMIGSVIGTPLYMSPEQVNGIPVDNRADIYSLGVMIYELLSGKPPFYEGDLAYQHIHVEPKPIKDIPPPLQDIVLKCLKKRPDDRWPDASKLADALEEFLDAFSTEKEST